MAASHPGPLFPVLAGENPVRAGAAASSTDHRPADQQAGGTVEGTIIANVLTGVIKIKKLWVHM